MRISEIFKRANLQRLRLFLLNESTAKSVSEKGWDERLEEACTPVFALLESLFPDMAEQERALEPLYHCIHEIEAVYFEIGLKCGFKLDRVLTE